MPAYVDDGEKLSDESLLQIFRIPPDAVSEFTRGTLVVGSRGVGKTTLLRYAKSRHVGFAPYISLLSTFTNLARRASAGPMQGPVSRRSEVLLAGQAVALLAIAIAERCLRRGVPIELDLLAPCLPLGHRGSPTLTTEALALLGVQVARAKARAVEHLFDGRALAQFCDAVAERSEATVGPLLLLLDRADMVPPSALVPLTRLLDQGTRFVTVIATRPGVRQHGPTEAAPIIAGDHFALLHLGTRPRASEWLGFVEAAIEAQLPGRLEQFSPELRGELLALTRDSVRTGLELVASSGADPSERFRPATRHLRAMQLSAMEATLRSANPNFRDFVDDARRDARDDDRIPGPVTVALTSTRPTLFPDPRRARFFDLALRTGAFSTVEGALWQPAMNPDEIEILPLLMWDNGTRFWDARQARTVRLSRGENAFFRRSGGAPPRPPIVFVAHRFDNPSSRRFFDEVAHACRSRPDLAGLDLQVGRPTLGGAWSSERLVKLAHAKVVIADLTGARPQIMFELGYALALGRPVLPVVAKPADRARLPEWLRRLQIGTYEEPGDINRILAGLLEHLSRRTDSTALRLPRPVPGVVGWLRVLPWNAEDRDRARELVQRESIAFEEYHLREDDPVGSVLSSEAALQQAVRAQILVASLDGTAEDALVHAACGAIVALPRVGYGTAAMPRQALVLSNGAGGAKMPGEHHPDLVKAVTPASLDRELELFGRRYALWRGGAPA